MTQLQQFATYAEASAASGRVLGGGTILMRQVNYHPQTVPQLVRITDPAATAIRREGSGVMIGAGVTMAQVIESQDLAPLAPVARAIGGPALRNMATVGGNLFAAHPYGDFTTALLALGASVTWASGQQEDLETFLTRRESAQGVVASISVPIPRAGNFRFRKVSRTKPKGISVMSIAFMHSGFGNRLENARLAFGAMAPTPLRAKSAEAALNGISLDDEAAVSRACQSVAQDLAPFDDAIASAWYRQKVAPIHLKRLLMGDGR